MKEEEEDPIVEIRRIREATAEEFDCNGDAMAAYYSATPLPPGMKLYDGPGIRYNKPFPVTRVEPMSAEEYQKHHESIKRRIEQKKREAYAAAQHE